MKFIRVAAAAATLVVLSGCVSSEQINAGVNTLKGKPYQSAFSTLGFPDEEKKIAGFTVYTWSNQSSGSYTVPTYNTATTYVNGQTVYSQIQGSQTHNYSYSCKLDLIVDSKGIVIDTKLEGDIGGCERYAALAPKKKS
ncbi:hypothetical protein [Agrobacterium burrii]